MLGQGNRRAHPVRSCEMNGTLDRLADTDLQTAHAVLKAKGRTFYWASHGLKALHAQRATRLYAFCRLVDDLADTSISPEAAKAELAGISEAIACRVRTTPASGIC